MQAYPHLLGHSHVTVALEARVDLFEVAASAGHRDARTTTAHADALRVVAGRAGAAVAAFLGGPGPTTAFDGVDP